MSGITLPLILYLYIILASYFILLYGILAIDMDDAYSTTIDLTNLNANSNPNTNLNNTNPLASNLAIPKS